MSAQWTLVHHGPAGPASFRASYYQPLREVASGELRSILDRLIPIEARHLAFWRDFFDLHVERLDLARRLKLRLLVFVCRLFGAPALRRSISFWKPSRCTACGSI